MDKNSRGSHTTATSSRGNAKAEGYPLPVRSLDAPSASGRRGADPGISLGLITSPLQAPFGASRTSVNPSSNNQGELSGSKESLVSKKAPVSKDTPKSIEPPRSKQAPISKKPSNVDGIDAVSKAGSCWEVATLRLQNAHRDKFEVLLSESRKGPLKEEEFRKALGSASDKQNESKKFTLHLERLWQALQPFQQLGMIAARADPSMVAPYAVASLLLLIQVLRSNQGNDGVYIGIC